MKLDHAVQSALLLMQGHADANETALFTRQLEEIYAQTYDVKYPDNVARKLIPVDSRPGPGAEFFTYRQFNYFGEARLIHNYANDFPNAEVQGLEFKQSIKGIGDSYQYTIQDLRASVMSGIPLEERKAFAARRLIENKIETLACIGDANTGMTGLANAPNIVAVSKGAQVTGTTWYNAGGVLQASVQEVLNDVNNMQKTIFQGTLGTIQPDTLVLGTKSYAGLATQQRAVGFTADSILQYILSQSPWLKSIEYWPRLDTAGAGGKERIMMYKKDPEILQLVISQEFEQFAPQPRNMAFVIPCHARCGGVSVKYPLGVAFMDGTEP